MVHDETPDTSRPTAAHDPLVEAVREVLQQDDLVNLVVAAVRRRLATSAQLEVVGLRREAASDTGGPLPIGPYEIRPDLGDLHWNVANPPGTEWLERAPAAGPPHAPDAVRMPRQGPHVPRGGQRGPADDDD